ncbi:flocculation protein FLO11 [Punica granatum]|uniref:Flocculation protein FLO11 n=1 Tax=Punica granatum TaxID=22663 RepID=A0A6P8DG17_PUNGR|nr:flocculation protein FLO11 [Punica granatum]
MEMDSSRRSFDRSREPGLKKPRLAAEEPNSRPFSLRPIGSGLNQVQSRYDRDADNNDASRGGGYQPQPLPLHQQHQELVEQYRTALSELTFNSKPIITNLTIIAGENLHAAKAVASTICAHILEVPSDQKLPSLYLLDSIVKNIGRDYIKYFAAKLPEVFCKAYRQVDPPIHSSMRHLFGTWKGVFHPQTLQFIEKELGFGSSANGSSAPATSRSDSQSQRPPHSIHVNPKYLERQRLQQSARPKGIANDMDGTLVNSSEDIERLDRPTGVTTGRTWAGPPVKTQRSQRDPRVDPLLDKKNIGVVYGDLEYSSDISRNPGLGPGRTVGKATEQKPWYGVGSGGITDTVSTQRNGFPAKQKLQGYPPPKSSNIDSKLSRSGGGMSTSWKNSEEEEFLWDSMGSRLTDRDAAINTSSIARKDHWASDGSEKLDFENNLPRTLSREGRNQVGALGTLSHSGLSDGYPAKISGLSTSGSSLSRTGIGSQMRSSSHTGTSGQQRIHSLGPPSPSAQSPIRQHSPPVDLARHPQTDLRTSQFSSKSSLGPSNRYGDDSLPIPSNVQSGSLKRHQPHESKAAAAPVISFQPTQLPQISQPVPAQGPGHQVISSVQDSAPENSPPPSVTSGQLSASTSSLLAALAKSGSINAMITSLPGLGSHNKGLEASQASSRALPGGHQSTQLPFPKPKSESSPVLATSHDTTSTATDSSQGKITKNEPEECPDVTKNSSDPISSLLSSLVAKGLISASKTESPAPVPPQTSKPLLNEKQDAITATPELVSSASLSTEIPVSAAVEEASVPEPVAETSDSPQPPAKTEEIKNLIGFELKPDVIRKFHSSVIDHLFDELPHQCGICGLRLQLKETLDRHLVWHASQNPKQKAAANASNKWYAHSSDWVAGRTGPHMYGAESIKVEEEKCSETSGVVGPMVPADETQCACVLCGELFEDFYDLGKDEWMFKGAVYMPIPCGTPEVSAETDSNFRAAVHANCLSSNSVEDLGFRIHVKKEEDA